jgi:hypothetical protein
VIGCEGTWTKHQDGPKRDVVAGFLTDSLGRVILNPSLLDLEYEDPWSCTARDRVGRVGQAYFFFVDGGTHVITIRRTHEISSNGVASVVGGRVRGR